MLAQPARGTLIPRQLPPLHLPLQLCGGTDERAAASRAVAAKGAAPGRVRVPVRLQSGSHAAGGSTCATQERLLGNERLGINAGSVPRCHGAFEKNMICTSAALWPGQGKQAFSETQLSCCKQAGPSTSNGTIDSNSIENQIIDQRPQALQHTHLAVK
jgi:hypothetical protein